MHSPNPETLHPMPGFPRVTFLKNAAPPPNVLVGDYTYYDDPAGPDAFWDNILYHYSFLGDKLSIGKFCAIATGVSFIMNGAFHRMSGVTTYPFQIFGNGWEKVMPRPEDLPFKGDTVVGNDVWLGYQALVMPGVKISDGAIISARAVVTKDVPPYAVVAGNPARVVRMRFEPEAVAKLLALAWWDWPVEKITSHLDILVAGNVTDLAGIADE